MPQTPIGTSNKRPFGPFLRRTLKALEKRDDFKVNSHEKGEPMNKRKILLLHLLTLTIFLFPYQTSFSQPLLDQRFPKDVAQSPLPKLLDFGAGTCIPCKAMAPILKDLTEEYKGRVVIKIIEVHQEREMTQANRIRLIPTQIFFDSKNQEVFRHEGFMDKEQIKKVFEKMGIK
jgi:thioredoxin 1